MKILIKSLVLCLFLLILSGCQRTQLYKLSITKKEAEMVEKITILSGDMNLEITSEELLKGVELYPEVIQITKITLKDNVKDAIPLQDFVIDFKKDTLLHLVQLGESQKSDESNPSLDGEGKLVKVLVLNSTNLTPIPDVEYSDDAQQSYISDKNGEIKVMFHSEMATLYEMSSPELFTRETNAINLHFINNKTNYVILKTPKIKNNSELVGTASFVAKDINTEENLEKVFLQIFRDDDRFIQELETQNNGVKIDLPPGNYYSKVVYKVGYTIDIPTRIQQFVVVPQKVSNVEYELPKTSIGDSDTLRLTVLDDENNPVIGALFSISQINGKFKDTITTDNLGNAYFSSGNLGEFDINLKLPKGYKKPGNTKFQFLGTDTGKNTETVINVNKELKPSTTKVN